MKDDELQSGFQVGDWLVRPDEGTIASPRDYWHLPPKQMEMLVCLARRQGQVVSKQTVLEEVWPGVFVTDSCVRAVVCQLRAALDPARGTATIVSIRKRGYRLALPVLRPGTTRYARKSADPARADEISPRQLCARAHQYFLKVRVDDLRLARQIYRHAARLDPEWVDSYTGIATCDAYSYLYFGGKADDLRAARTAAQTALVLAPENPQAVAIDAFVQELSGNHTEARDRFEEAVRLGPEAFEPHYLYARSAFASQDDALAAELAATACRVRPNDYRARSMLGFLHGGLGRRLAMKSTLERCARSLDRHLAFNPDDSGAACILADTLLRLGRVDDALGRIPSLEPEAAGDPYLAYGIATVYARTDLPTRATAMFAASVEAGFSHREWIDSDSDLDPVRDLPAFRAVADRIPAKRLPV